MPQHATKTSFSRGHTRSVESRLKQAATMRKQYADGRVSPLLGKKTRKGHTPPKAARVCEYCATTYQPNNPKQRWCTTCVPHIKARRLMQRYNLSWPAYQTAMAAPCPLCSRAATVVDHDHKTGKTRAALCNGCNVALSRFEEFGWAEKASLYLKQHGG